MASEPGMQGMDGHPPAEFVAPDGSESDDIMRPCSYSCQRPKGVEVGTTWTCPRCGTEWVLEAYEDHFVGVDVLASIDSQERADG